MNKDIVNPCSGFNINKCKFVSFTNRCFESMSPETIGFAAKEADQDNVLEESFGQMKVLQ
jgi:hypothetical protein